MYPGIFNLDLIYRARTWILAVGMNTFIFMVEIDEKLHGVSQKNKKFSFYLTIISLIGNIKEIEHSNKKILFSSGTATACILITTDQSNEFRYRLEMFHLSFEKPFSVDKLKNWTGDVREFRKANDLITEHFA